MAEPEDAHSYAVICDKCHETEIGPQSLKRLSLFQSNYSGASALARQRSSIAKEIW